MKHKVIYIWRTTLFTDKYNMNRFKTPLIEWPPSEPSLGQVWAVEGPEEGARGPSHVLGGSYLPSPRLSSIVHSVREWSALH